MNKRGINNNNNHVNLLTKRTLSLDDTDTIISFSSNTPLVLLVALGLLVGAQGFINSMASGDQGLGAFLQDGSGYNKSAYKPSTDLNTNNEDPLPWLSLPRLDFVDVAGQQDDAIDELERIRQEMNDRLQEGKIEEATILRDKLQVLMKESGFEYEADGESPSR